MAKSGSSGLIAVIDTETTGLHPHWHDRIIEIAIVVVDMQGRTHQEFDTLLNPNRDVGPTRIHGLSASDLIDAPKFSEVVSHLINTLNGTIGIAGHNVRFDYMFLRSEFARIGYSMPECPLICTMRLCGTRKLETCCKDFRLPFNTQFHHALTDARATAALLARVLPDFPHLRRAFEKAQPIRWPVGPAVCKPPMPRAALALRPSKPPDYWMNLIDRLPANTLLPPGDEKIQSYISLLDRVLEDRIIEDWEATALIELAKQIGIDKTHIEKVHREYLKYLIMVAFSDGHLTEVERDDICRVANLLGLNDLNVDEYIKSLVRDLKSTELLLSIPTPIKEPLVGKTVCFTGESRLRYKGRAITRDVAKNLAKMAGLSVVDSVTKKLDILVVADPDTMSAKAKKAREYAIRVIYEPVFWSAVGIRVE